MYNERVPVLTDGVSVGRQGFQDCRAVRGDDIQDGHGRPVEVRVDLHGVRDGILAR